MQKHSQNSTSFYDKSTEEIRNRRNVPQHNKDTHDKPIANIILNIILNGEKPNPPL
jgi:hypothetical protein